MSQSFIPIVYGWRMHCDASWKLVFSLDGASDHGVSEAVYLRDPDGNGVELYSDRPKELWPRATDGSLAMYSLPLNIRELLAEATNAGAALPVPNPGAGPEDL
jgi:catechol-2,3-dioxygenase